MSDNGFLLQVKDLCTWFYTYEGVVKAVDGVSFGIKRGEILGLVGEGGCGKTMTALSVLRLFSCPPGKIVRGEIEFEGMDLLRLSEAQMRTIRPMTSLNPLITIGSQISEVLLAHQHLKLFVHWSVKIAQSLKVIGDEVKYYGGQKPI